MTDEFIRVEGPPAGSAERGVSAGRATPAERAGAAAAAVTRGFGRRLLGLPFTHLGAVRRPAPPLSALREPWHYWWQAHYVDCLVDAGWREHRSGRRFDGPRRPSAGRLASRVVRTVRLRNFFRVVNNYYDDMAWLALATARLDALAAETERPAGTGRRPLGTVRRLILRRGHRGRRQNRRINRILGARLESAHTPDLGGGLFWNTERDFKNAPATAPAALFFARSGQAARAQALVEWLNISLLDAERGIYLDGLRIVDGRPVMVPDVYSYNQGPVLGALLTLGGEKNLAAASRLVQAVERELTVDVAGCRVLMTHGGGDGGLFTGILARYLALAAAHEELPATIRDAARQLVDATADALWEGRRIIDGQLAFARNPAQTAHEDYPPGVAVELSTQLQAWMVFEAAAAGTNYAT